MELLTTGITFFQKGGIVMYVLLLCSLFVFSIGIERAMYFRRMDSGRAFARDFYLALANNKWQKAEQLADHARGALADILFAVITKKPEARKNPSAYMEIRHRARENAQAPLLPQRHRHDGTAARPARHD